MESESQMLPGDDELYRRVYEIAHYVWDPIGISEIPEANNEYNSYMMALFGRAKSGDADALVEYMQWVETEQLGLAFDADKAKRAAKAMIAWKRYIEEDG